MSRLAMVMRTKLSSCCKSPNKMPKRIRHHHIVTTPHTFLLLHIQTIGAGFLKYKACACYCLLIIDSTSHSAPGLVSAHTPTRSRLASLSISSHDKTFDNYLMVTCCILCQARDIPCGLDASFKFFISSDFKSCSPLAESPRIPLRNPRTVHRFCDTSTRRSIMGSPTASPAMSFAGSLKCMKASSASSPCTAPPPPGCIKFTAQSVRTQPARIIGINHLLTAPPSITTLI